MRIARLTADLRTAAVRVTKSSIMRALKKDDFRLDYRDKKIMTRQVEVLPGVNVTEIKGTKINKKRSELVPSGPSKF
jgi:hypothetical protein